MCRSNRSYYDHHCCCCCSDFRFVPFYSVSILESFLLINKFNREYIVFNSFISLLVRRPRSPRQHHFPWSSIFVVVGVSICSKLDYHWSFVSVSSSIIKFKIKKTVSIPFIICCCGGIYRLDNILFHGRRLLLLLLLYRYRSGCHWSSFRSVPLRLHL